MVFKAKKGKKRSRHWYRVFNWCVEQCLGVVAKQILPNRMRYEVAGKHRQEFQQKLACCWRLKQFLQLCNAFLGLSSSNSHLEMVKHIKFDHVLDTIFCAFWTEFVHRARRFLFTSYPRMISFGISFAWWGALSPVVLSFGSICPHWEEKSYPKLRAQPLYLTLLTSLAEILLLFSLFAKKKFTFRSP